MRAERFDAHITAGPRGQGVIAIPFDPDEAWGTKASHPVNGAVNGRRIRGRLTRDDGGWTLMVSPMCLADAASGHHEVSVELAPEGPQRADLADDIAAALDASPAGERLILRACRRS